MSQEGTTEGEACLQINDSSLTFIEMEAPASKGNTSRQILRQNTNDSLSDSSAMHNDSNDSTHIITLDRRKQGFEPVQRMHLRNDLLLIVGYLEFFNALDFPANIWNSIPIPKFAMGLMAAGGSAALIASVFAFLDLRRSWRNVSALCAERIFLKKLCSSSTDSLEHYQYVQAWSSLNFREYGWELIDRSLMDGLVGFAAILVGVGTIMAVRGADHHIFIASNLLSGYIGNGFVALYSLVNAAWSAYLWIRAQRHKRVVQQYITDSTIKKRAMWNFRKHQTYAIVNGITLLVSGAGSIITSTRWWGYIMLIPCIVSSVFCNIFWRKLIGYDRVLKQFQSSKSIEFDIYSAIEDAIKTQNVAHDVGFIRGKLALMSFTELISFMEANEMLQDFCVHVANKPFFQQAVGLEITCNKVNISTEMLQALDYQLLLSTAQSFIVEFGAICARDRERMLYELLGSHLHLKAVEQKQQSCSPRNGTASEVEADEEQPTEKACSPKLVATSQTQPDLNHNPETVSPARNVMPPQIKSETDQGAEKGTV